MAFLPRCRTAALPLALLLGACGAQPSADTVATLAADPVRLQVLRARCRHDRAAVGEARCRTAAQADRQRFFSGQAGPYEYRTLAALPPIPASFDAPVPADAVAESSP